MGFTNFPKGFPSGVTIRGVPVVSMSGGNVFWVDSGNAHASNSNKGDDQDKPFSTIEYAIGKCTANNGDIIFVKSGHTETIIADSGIDVDIAGVAIVGLGSGSDMPTITFTTNAAADFKLAAANAAIHGLLFKCNIASQAMMVEVTGKDCWIQGNRFEEGTATGLNFITVGVADNDADRCVVKDNIFYAPTAGNYASAIAVAKDMIGVEIRKNHVYGDFDDAPISIPVGGNAQVNCTIADNELKNLQTGDHAIEINGTGSTGFILDNKCSTDTSTIVIDSGGLSPIGNTWAPLGDSDFEGVPALPVLDAATNFIGADDANNTASTSNVAANEDGSILERLEQIQEVVNNGTGTAIASNKSLADAIGFNGSAAITGTAGMLRTKAGTEIVITKTLTSSAVLSAGVDVTAVSTVGGLFLKDWTIRTSSTGLATGTNFTLETNNVNGAAIFCSHAVASLGANILIDKKTATTGKSTYLETGKKIIAKCTVADCTGAGTIAIDLNFVSAVDNAGIAAA